MKKGDIIIMPKETIAEGSTMSVGIVMRDPPADSRKVDVLWNDAEGVVYQEPRDWMQVIGHIDGWGLKYNMLNASEEFLHGIGVQSFSS